MSFSQNTYVGQQKLQLSGSTAGRPIALGSSGTAVTIHTTSTSSRIYDEIWIYAANTGSTNAVITVSFAGTTAIKVTVPPSSGLTLVVPGTLLSGTGSASSTITVTDTSSTGNAYVHGYVFRTTL